MGKPGSVRVRLPRHLPIREVLNELSLDFTISSPLGGWRKGTGLHDEKLLQEVIDECGWSLLEFERGMRDAGIVLIKKKTTSRNRGRASKLLLESAQAAAPDRRSSK